VFPADADQDAGEWAALSPPAATAPEPGDATRQYPADDNGRNGGHRVQSDQPPGGAADSRAPSRDRQAQPDDGAVRAPLRDRQGRPDGGRPQGTDAERDAVGTQPGRTRAHVTGAHSTRIKRQARRKRWPLAAACLALVVVLGGGVYVLVNRGHASPAGTSAAKSTGTRPPSPQPSTPTPTPTPTGRWGHIATRAADPRPLTLAEVFPARFTAGASYSRTVRRQGTGCPAAVIGARLQRAVRKAGCSQVLRASYLSVGRKLMGTIGVLNLKTVSAAEKAGRAAGPAEFIAQLAAAKGPTRRLTRGTGIEEADIKGHYLILVWGEFTSLHAPKTKAQRRALESFLSELIDKTANVSLTSRMVSGTP
jgi:hypothetical protein